MDELAENGYGAISRKTGASEALVREECDLIRSLNPRPGTGFSRRENLSYVTPDVLVLPGEDEELEVQVNGGGLPPLDLSVYYSNLLLETPDEEVRLYLSEKLNQARSIVENINGRQALLERCAKKIVAEQEEFFPQRPRLPPPAGAAAGSRRAGSIQRMDSLRGKGQVSAVPAGHLSHELVLYPGEYE